MSLYSIAGYVVQQGKDTERLFGPFKTPEEALEFMNGDGLNLSGPLCIKIVLGADLFRQK